MTAAELAVLDAIRDLSVGGISPSYQEIADRAGLGSKSGVYRVVAQLALKGRIIRRGKTRCWEVSERGLGPAAIACIATSDLWDLKGRIDAELSRRSQRAAA